VKIKNKTPAFDEIPAEKWKIFCTMKKWTKILSHTSTCAHACTHRDIHTHIKKGKNFSQTGKLPLSFQFTKETVHGENLELQRDFAFIGFWQNICQHFGWQIARVVNK
jgi:kynurenine formamidase